MSRDRERERGTQTETEKEDKETIKKKIVVVDTFLFCIYTPSSRVYISRLHSFSCIVQYKRESKKRNPNEHQVTCKWY